MSASPSILANKDINVPTMNHMNSPAEFEKKAPMVADPHSMEYHRQVLQNKLEQKDQYVCQSPNPAFDICFRATLLGPMR
jgi:hypothetical protein